MLAYVVVLVVGVLIGYGPLSYVGMLLNMTRLRRQNAELYDQLLETVQRAAEADRG